MKLYTEYNLKEVYFKGLYNGQNHIEGECHNAIDSQTPIELPTKEQIDDFAFPFPELVNIKDWKSGAEWTLNQILNQNK